VSVSEVETKKIGVLILVVRRARLRLASGAPVQPGVVVVGKTPLAPVVDSPIRQAKTDGDGGDPVPVPEEPSCLLA